MKRIKTLVYDKWSGNPRGISEKPEYCIQSVPDRSGFHSYQCSRKRGHGIGGCFCKQHAKIIQEKIDIFGTKLLKGYGFDVTEEDDLTQ